ncbi:MAG: TIGR02757 family protein [Victivallales bacterium]|nr:TIGR02757 family protein [Victivallales bacterium]
MILQKKDIAKSISVSLKRKLRLLAAKYETADFMKEDPSQFMHRYTEPLDVEITAFMAANLAFGRRSCILNCLEKICQEMGGSPTEWLLSRRFEKIFSDSGKSFYRIYSHRNMRYLCDTMKRLILENGSLGAYCRRCYENGDCEKHPGRLAAVIADCFPENCKPLISNGKTSANKRLNLFLRWMVRQNSPVDLGLWDWYPPTKLLMPLDTHVVAVAKEFGLVPENAMPNLKLAIKLTDIMSEIFPGDPLKGDFALFGHGIMSTE